MAEPLRVDSAIAEHPSVLPATGWYALGGHNTNTQTQSIGIISAHTIFQAFAASFENLSNDPDSISSRNIKFINSLSRGDIVAVNQRTGYVRNILAKKSNAKTLLLTEQCDNRCLFCSQPPKEANDEHLFQLVHDALLSFDNGETVIISGGEPTLNRERFIWLLESSSELGALQAIKVLSNGRSFADLDFLERVAECCVNRQITWGIPLYAHNASIHDFLVGAEGAFNETCQGLLNALSFGINIEIRVIPTQQNLRYLAPTANFISNFFPAVAVVSVMNMEPQGWARKNFENLFVSVLDQAPEIEKMNEIFSFAGIRMQLFNYPLCMLESKLHENCVKSISDWKNYYPSECGECRLQYRCGGLFSSANGKFEGEVRPWR